MPGLSHRRPASVSTSSVSAVLRGMIKETLCISVAESECALSSNRLFLQPQYVSLKILQCQNIAMNLVVDDISVDILCQYP